MDLPADILKDAQDLWTRLSNQRSDGTRLDPITEIARTLWRERQRNTLYDEARGASFIETIVANIF